MNLEITIPRTQSLTLTKSMAMEVNMFVGGIRGSTGDMTAAVYDPQGIEADVFDMDNMVEGVDAKILRVKISVGITEPVNPSVNDLWIDTN